MNKLYIITNYTFFAGVFFPSDPMTWEELQEAVDGMERLFRFGLIDYHPEIVRVKKKEA